jgi:photosystem II stability/assembly factor-like uncharacterized protein
MKKLLLLIALCTAILTQGWSQNDPAYGNLKQDPSGNRTGQVSHQIPSSPAWQVIPSGVTEDLYSVHFGNSTDGFISGATSRCLKSTDEGRNWSVVPVASLADFRSVWATSSNDAYLGAWDSIYATHDGGQSWAGAYTNTFTIAVMDLHFISPDHGFAFMQVSSISNTTDAGNSWSVPTGCGIIEDFYDGYMLDDSTGFGVGDCGLIAKTTNGGASFTLYEWNNYTEWSCIKIWGVYFTSALNGYATADSGAVFRTTDGGDHWSRSVIAGPEDLLNDVFFVNASTGYIVGYNGLIFKTTDGGDSWIPEPSATTNDLYSVFFDTENLGWAVGSNGTILRYGFPLGINNPVNTLSGSLNIFPNPASDLLNVDLKITEGGQYTLQLIDNTGRVVRQVIQSSLNPGSYKYIADISNLPAGIYLCKLSNGMANCSNKIIVNR